MIFRKYVRPYSTAFRLEFASCFSNRFGGAAEPSDRFWLCFEYVAYHCPVAFARAMHFLNLYGFNRNISFALLFSAFVSFFLLWARDYPLPCLVPVGLLLASIPFYWNYLKLLRRLNDEVFRAFFFHARSYPR
jgi:hypothetical protein